MALTWSQGTRLGRYELVAPLGRGGMGEVWEAELAGPVGFRKRVALKLLKLDRPMAGAREALLSEARLGALLSHPNVVSTLELGSADGHWFVAMELVRGPSTAWLARHRDLTPAALLEIGIQVCAGLTHIHELRVQGAPAGLVHRDVKPRNLLVDPHGLVKIADLGIARLSDDATDVLGTPGYMAPEAMDGLASPASDLFSVGSVLLALRLGRNPFGRGDAAVTETLRVDEHLRDPAFVRPVEELVPGLGAVVARALAADPARRWHSAAEMGAALRALRPTIDPVPGLQELVGDEATPPSSDSSGDVTLVLAAPATLPAATDPFFGRTRELAELGTLLDDGVRLVTLLGPGGMGKTRLSLELARSRPTGALFVELEDAEDARDLASAVAEALDLEPTGGSVDARVGHALAARGPTLLVLDNLEQAVEPAAAVLGRWLAVAADLVVLATSRVPLKVRGERTLVLDSLRGESAVALFSDRAGRPFDGTEGAAVARLVEALDGLPLAIELAAARTRMMPPSAILERLQDRFRLLTGGGGERPGRHRTLRAAIDGSWDVLADWGRLALGQLSVFEAPFTLQAAEAVLQLPPEAPWTLDVLADLVDHSLVRVDAERFRLLGAVRAYAAEAVEPGARAAAELRHGEWFAQLGSREVLEQLAGGARAQLTAVLEARAELVAACRRAVARGDADVAGATAFAACEAIDQAGPFEMSLELLEGALSVAGGKRRLELAISRAAWLSRVRDRRASLEELEQLLGEAEASGDQDLVGQARLVLGSVLWQAGIAARGEELLRAAIPTLEAVGSRRRLLRARANLASIVAGMGRPQEALGMFDDLLITLRDSDQEPLLARVLTNRGNLLADVGRHTEALATLERAVAMNQRAGARRSAATAMGNLAHVRVMAGQSDLGRTTYALAARLYETLGERDGLAFVEMGLGILEARTGNLVDAQTHMTRANQLYREVGNRRFEGGTLANLGAIANGLGRVEEAVSLFEQSIAIHRETGHRRSEGQALGNLALALQELGRMDEARACLEDALVLHREVGNTRSESIALTALARMAWMTGQLEHALQLVDQAEPLAASVGDPLSLGRTLQQRGLVQRDQGDLRGAEASLLAAAEHFGSMGNDAERSHADALRAEVVARTDPATARAILARVIAPADSQDTRTLEDLRLAVARARERLGEP